MFGRHTEVKGEWVASQEPDETVQFAHAVLKWGSR